MIQPIIKAHDLKIVYNAGKSNEYVALRVNEFEIYPEEYIIFFGPSGCGKSTLLYCLLGILPPTSGELFVKGENPYKYTPQRMVQFQRSTIGIIYQSFNLIPSLSVLDNVALPCIFANMSKAERDEKGMQFLKRYGVDAQANKLSSNLSGGQMQRVAVARSLMNNPEILLGDEPVGNLDSISTQQVMQTLSEVNTHDKKTIILVTHDAKHLPYAHRVYHFKDGYIEREVVNPERPQIKPIALGKTILTEMEKLARLYPYITQTELRVKSIVNYLTQDIGFDQIERLEKIVELMISGKANSNDVLGVLERPVVEGGVGLTHERSEAILVKIDKILEEALQIRRYRFRRTQNITGTSKQDDRISTIRNALLEEFKMHVSDDEVVVLDTMVANRISGLIQTEDFEFFASRPANEKGLELTAEAAHMFTGYLEKLIAQAEHI
jgi:putative ABC transport system ATP-binding protein